MSGAGQVPYIYWKVQRSYLHQKAVPFFIYLLYEAFDGKYACRLNWKIHFDLAYPGLDSLSPANIWCERDQSMSTRVFFWRARGKCPEPFPDWIIWKSRASLPVSFVTLRHVLGRIALKMKLYAEKMDHIGPKMIVLRKKKLQMMVHLNCSDI